MSPAVGILWHFFQQSARSFLAHLYRAVKDSAFFNKQHRCYQIAMHSARLSYFYFRSCNQVALKRALNDAYAHVELSFDRAHLTNNQGSAFARKLARHFAVYLKPVCEK